MIIGIPKEIMTGENRVALTPEAVQSLIEDGHEVIVEGGSGIESGFKDGDYINVGAKFVEGHDNVFDSADIIVKVKEILPEEYRSLREGKILFTYLHLTEGPIGAERVMAEALIKSKVVAFAYDTVQLEDGSRPLLAPMSEIAGQMGVIFGAFYLQKHFGGKGVMLGRIAGLMPINIVVIGGGAVGMAAAKAAIDLGANVTVLEVDVNRIKMIQDVFKYRVTTLYSNKENLKRCIKIADVLINAVFFTPTMQRKHIVTRKMVELMEPGSVIVDIGSDEGGAIETSKITSHDDPVYIVDDVVHYCVPNIPGAFPRTASYSLSNAILPYVRLVANQGWVNAVKEKTSLRKGLNVAFGKLVHRDVAACQGLEWYPLENLLKEMKQSAEIQ